MTVMQNTHGSEIFSSREMMEVEKFNFLKKKSYYFMERAGYKVFQHIKTQYKKIEKGSIEFEKYEAKV